MSESLPAWLPDVKPHKGHTQGDHIYETPLREILGETTLGDPPFATHLGGYQLGEIILDPYWGTQIGGTKLGDRTRGTPTDGHNLGSPIGRTPLEE
jgi:hypothetical protein